MTELAGPLNTALAAAQGEFPPIPRDKTVTVKTKTGGSYTFSYAPLETILAACRPVLAAHGLALIQLLEENGHGPAIRTELRHKDGGVLGASFPLPGTPNTPQELGSLLTYLRRYAIVALLGIATEEDDDGQQAADTPMRKPANREQKIVSVPTSTRSKPTTNVTRISSSKRHRLAKINPPKPTTSSSPNRSAPRSRPSSASSARPGRTPTPRPTSKRSCCSSTAPSTSPSSPANRPAS